MTPLAQSRGERFLYLAYVALTLYFAAPLLVTGDRLGVVDWDVMLFYHAAVIKSVAEYGVLPFWNPWYCGGNVLWQNPQVALLSPVYLFSLVVSLPMAMKINIASHYLVGFAGMHVLLTRGFKLLFLPAVFFLACLFTLAGGPVFHLTAGHATFLPYFFLPWLLFFTIRAIETGRWRHAVSAAVVLALAIYNGGIQIAFMASVGLGCFAVAASALRRDWRPLAMVAAAGALALLFAAPKLLPVAAFVSDPMTVDTRIALAEPDVMGRDMVMRAFMDPFQYRRLQLGQPYQWHEYGNYLGPLGALVIVATFLWLLMRWREERWQSRSLALTALALFLFMLGEFGPLAPYVLLRRLPMVSGFRLPSRYSLVFVPFAAAMVGSVWQTLFTGSGRDARRFAGVVLILSSGALAYWNHIQFEGAFTLPPLESSFHFLSRPPAPTVDAATEGLAVGSSPMLRGMMENRAVLRCYEPLQLPGAIDPTRPSVFPEDGARVADVEFAPGQIRFRAQTENSQGRVFLNERFARGWQTDVGEFTVDSQTGLAFVAIPPGSTARFTFRFVPPLLIAGLVCLGAGLILSVALWRRTLVPRSMVQFSHAVR